MLSKKFMNIKNTQGSEEGKKRVLEVLNK